MEMPISTFQGVTKGAFFWDFSGYSFSGLGITEYTEFQFLKEHSFILKTEYSWRRSPENYYVFQPEARQPPRAAALDFPPKSFQKKKKYSAYSVKTVFRSFCSLYCWEQNERNDIPFIPNTDYLRKEHEYRLFRVILFRNSPKRTRPKNS